MSDELTAEGILHVLHDLNFDIRRGHLDGDSGVRLKNPTIVLTRKSAKAIREHFFLEKMDKWKQKSIEADHILSHELYKRFLEETPKPLWEDMESVEEILKDESIFLKIIIEDTADE